MSDDKNFFDKQLSIAERVRGERPGMDEIKADFATYDPMHRATSLESIEADMNADDLTLDKRAELLATYRQLNDIHRAMHKARR